MREIKRYNLEEYISCEEPWQAMYSRPDGEWMKWEDHLAEISRLHEELCICKGMRMVAETRLAKANAFLESQKLGNVLKEAGK